MAFGFHHGDGETGRAPISVHLYFRLDLNVPNAG
jgi:hypothetical protein